jgi:hypothetical protein
MDDEGLAALLARQEGVVSRAQVLDLGGDDLVIVRRLRGRHWRRMFEGVYVDHTGPPTWRQRAWAAVLVHAPSALEGRSACIAHGLAEEDRHPILTVVTASRRVDDPPGVVSRRIRDYDTVVLGHLSPPRVRVEHAVLQAASSAATDDAAVARLAVAVQRRRTTPARLRATLATLPRLPRRRFLAEVLEDVDAGALSPLERRYLREVERAHGLPRGERQVRETSGSTNVYRDVAYAAQDALVELGTATSCGPSCAVRDVRADRGGSCAPGAEDPPRSPGSAA